MERILIFDFDGVLAESLPVMLAYAEQTCEELGHPCRATQEDLESLDRMEFTDFGRQLGLPEDKLLAFARRNFELFNSRMVPLPIVSGMRDAVSNLSDRFKIAIVTGNSKTTVGKFLDHHNLSGAIDLILSAEDPGRRADKINHVRELLGGSGSEVVMIGDAVSDIRAAREAGVKSLAVTWGHQSKIKLSEEKPDYMVESPGALLSLLDGGG